MTVNVTNYAVVQLPVRDVDASLRWYKDVLGIPFTFTYTPGDEEAWLNVGGVGLGLIRCPVVPRLEFTNSRGELQPIISLQVDNIHDAYEVLKNKGAELGEMIYKPQGGYSFTFRDPDGHVGHLWGGWPQD
ncbi:VOC family protein [Paenibacillus sambharensis]|uniref:VOC family protein n=1 Tax=Paenibacillus sambharensis TaxID=1803190 RepID=A0A2W1LEH6_9BACL|nr:VOC family protein [Paenibacillus sambharensis]PZD96490.1 VOC family protein [Paenibacillus sambharensis]